MRCANLLLPAAILAACSSGGSVPTGTGSPSPSGRTLSLAVGEAASVPGAGVTIVRIALAALDPYPAGEPIDPLDYVATLQIED